MEDRVARPERRRRLGPVERFQELESLAQMAERAVTLVGEDRHQRELAEHLRQLITEGGRGQLLRVLEVRPALQRAAEPQMDGSACPEELEAHGWTETRRGELFVRRRERAREVVAVEPLRHQPEPQPRERGMRGAERFLAEHEDLCEERLRVVARRAAPTELDEEERQRGVVLRSELLRENPTALQH